MVSKNNSMKILLNEIIHERKLSLRQVSVMTGLPKSTVDDIANNRKSPRMDEMEALAAGLNVKITDLFDSDYK